MSDDLHYHRRHLPHYYAPNAVYFVTSRLAGSLPQSARAQAREERRSIEQQLRTKAKSDAAAVDFELKLAWLDKILEKADKNICWLSDPRIADLVAEAIKYRDGKDYDLMAYSIMPNHMHLVFGVGVHDMLEPTGQIVNLSNTPLSKIMHSLKRYTATEANRILQRSGSFWQDESYDHIVRSGEELARIIEYVLNNPVKAGFVKKWSDWKWTYLKYQI